jgi:hypothetical protein
MHRFMFMLPVSKFKLLSSLVIEFVSFRSLATSRYQAGLKCGPQWCICFQL